MSALRMLVQNQFWAISKPLSHAISKHHDSTTGILCSLLYAEIASAMVAHNSTCIFRSVEKIKDNTTLSDRVQRRCRKVLVELGFMKIKRMGVPARLYYIFDDECESVLTAALNENKLGNTPNQTEEPVITDRQNQLLRNAITSTNAKQGQDSAQSHDIIKNTSIKNTKSNKSMSDSKNPTVFDDFWDKFKNKVGSKKACRTYFNRLSKANQDHAIKIIPLYHQWLKITGIQIKQPLGWLKKYLDTDFEALIKQERVKNGKNIPAADLKAVRGKLMALYGKYSIRGEWKDKYTTLAKTDIARAMELVKAENPNWF